MKYIKKQSCIGCLWYEDCDHECRCDGYWNEHDEETKALNEYEQNLAERAEAYDECIRDYND